MDQGRVVDIALFTGPLDGLQDGVDRVGHGQQRVGDLRGHLLQAVSQSGQQALPDVGDLLQVGETQEPTGPLDGVDRTEHAGQQFMSGRVVLELDQLLGQLFEVLVAFHQELRDNLVDSVH